MPQIIANAIQMLVLLGASKNETLGTSKGQGGRQGDHVQGPWQRKLGHGLMVDEWEIQL